MAAESPVAAVEGTKPDIYYIILDSYTRADTLQTAYRFDNSEFLGGLEEMGFDVAECSMSNYVRTELSLASSFNMDYLPVLDKRIKPDSQARSPLWNLIRNSAVMDYVEGQGYKTVAFATGFPWSEWDHADLYLEASPLRGGLTEFEGLLLDTTAYRIAEDEGLVDTKLATFNRYRERSQFVLDTLPSLAQMDGPQFVFAHIIVPHPPFVFAEDGSRSDSLSFLNAKDQYPVRQIRGRLCDAVAVHQPRDHAHRAGDHRQFRHATRHHHSGRSRPVAPTKRTPTDHPERLLPAQSRGRGQRVHHARQYVSHRLQPVPRWQFRIAPRREFFLARALPF